MDPSENSKQGTAEKPSESKSRRRRQDDPQGTPSRRNKTSPESAPNPNSAPSGPSQLSDSQSPRRVKKKTGVVEPQPENEDDKPPRTTRPQETSDPSTPKPKIKTGARGKTDPNEADPFKEAKFQSKDRTKPFQPATLTGFRELPIGKAFLILLLWAPRFFIPWITAWHEFNVYILSNPWHWESREGELRQHKMFVFMGRSVIALLSSTLVDLIRKKCELEYYIHIVFLVLFNLCPLAGGILDVLLRAQFHDEQVYTDWWFTLAVLMPWAMAVAFMMFPVQSACIYIQHNKMSRNAHYNWTSLFVLLESINAYVAYLLIPHTCPTQDWVQIVVWVAIGLLMITVTMITLIFMFAVRALKYAMLKCCNVKTLDKEPDDPAPFVDVPSNLWTKKLMWFSMMALPIILSYFSFAVLELFVPDEDWDDHHFLSALGLFLFWKIIGVILMVTVMFVVRKVYLKKKKLSILRAEILYLGVPHVLFVLALVIMVGRFATLSQPNEGDIIDGPLGDKDKLVLIFVNTMFRNRTVCVSSEYFRPLKIRPKEYGTREISDIDVEKFIVTTEVDPTTHPALRTRWLHVENITKGEWKVYIINLLEKNETNIDIWDYYRTLYDYSIRDVGNLLPKVGAPQVVFFQRRLPWPPNSTYYQLNHSSLGTEIVHLTPLFYHTGSDYEREIIYWVPPETGEWTVRDWTDLFTRSHVSWDWISNCSHCVVPVKFTVENNSLYLIVDFVYEEIFETPLPYEYFDDPPPGFQYPGNSATWALFKLGEVAGPNSDRLPSKKKLEKDWAIKISMALAGMAAGGVYLGLVYLFWVDPPMPRYRTISLAVCWVLVGVAAEIPRITLFDVDTKMSFILLTLQIFMTALHFVGAYFMYTPVFNFRIRPD